jgi:hypothetical protein
VGRDVWGLASRPPPPTLPSLSTAPHSSPQVLALPNDPYAGSCPSSHQGHQPRKLQKLMMLGFMCLSTSQSYADTPARRSSSTLGGPERPVFTRWIHASIVSFFATDGESRETVHPNVLPQQWPKKTGQRFCHDLDGRESLSKDASMWPKLARRAQLKPGPLEAEEHWPNS